MTDDHKGETMAEALATGLQDAHQQAERLYTLQAQQAATMMSKIDSHGALLGSLLVDVAVIKERTSDLPDVKRRLEALERDKSRKDGMSAAAILGIQAASGLIVLVLSHFWPR